MAFTSLLRRTPSFSQQDAGLCQVRGNLNVVFMSSDNTALVHMKSRSSWSRASTSLAVRDIPDDATAFLEHRFKLDHARAAELVRDVTGGRFSLLLDPSVAVKSVAAILDEKYTVTSSDEHEAFGLGLKANALLLPSACRVKGR